MTQTDFDQLPILLRYAQVVAVLEGVNRRSLLESIEDGSLRRWPAPPSPFRHGYYLKRDVAAMAGLQLRLPDLARLEGWMHRRELLRLLGLGRRYYLAAARAGLLQCEHERQRPWRLRLAGPAWFAAVHPGSTAVDGAKLLTTDSHP